MASTLPTSFLLWLTPSSVSNGNSFPSVQYGTSFYSDEIPSFEVKPIEEKQNNTKKFSHRMTHSSKGNKCAICFNSDNEFYELMCVNTHSAVYCETCLNRWLMISPTCPMCRAIVKL